MNRVWQRLFVELDVSEITAVHPDANQKGIRFELAVLIYFGLWIKKG